MKVMYPRDYRKTAKKLGEMRNTLNAELMASNPSFCRGERGDYASAIGILGELIVRKYLADAGTKFIAAPLIEKRPISGPDIIIGNNRYDVKTVREDAPDLLVNKDAHLKAKGITHYWFVKLLDEDFAKFYIFPYSEVDSWDIKNCKYTDAFFKEINVRERC